MMAKLTLKICCLIPIIAASVGHAAADEEFCAWAQQALAQTSIVPAVVVNTDREAFIDSKSFDEPFTTQQYWSSHRPGGVGEPTVVSCKMRTAERINATKDPQNGQLAALGDRNCHDLHSAMLQQAYSEIPPQEQVIARERWLVADEDLKFMGPKWLDPWPFRPLSEGENGQLQLNTRGLYVPMAWWIPMPERFLGNYYCHLIAPGYLESLIRGVQQPIF